MSGLELRHPESQLLLPYLDGELPARQARQVRRHVEACWQCRTELEELQRTVGKCIRYRRHWQQAPQAQPPQPWGDLSRELARIDASSARRPLLARPLFRWAALAASSAALVAATLTLRTWDRNPADDPESRPQTPAVKHLPESSSASPASTAAGPAGAQPVPSRAPQRQPLIVEAGIADELRAVAALHQLGADLGDPVEVAREGGRVVVRGAGVSPLRERQIRQALLSLPNVEVQFPEPAVSSAPGPAEPPGRLQATAPPTAVQNRLEVQLGGHTQFERFSSQLLDYQEAAMARIYALRRLATEFPAAAESQLTVDNRQLLRDLGREHLAALTRQIGAIQRAAAPVLAGLQPLPGTSEPRLVARPSGSGAATWQAAAEDVFASGRQVDSSLAALLGMASPEPGQSGDLPHTFLTALAQLQLSVQQCELILKR